MRSNRLLEEKFFNVDYLIHQPMSRLIQLIKDLEMNLNRM